MTIAITATRGRGFGFDRADVLLCDAAPVAWTIRSVMARNSLVALVGDPAAGKSFLALDWAAHVATGRPWNGRETTPGTVFYIAGEGHFGIRRRLAAWQAHYGVDLSSAPLYVSHCAALLDQSPDVAAVCSAVEAIVQQCGQQPALVIVDTLARTFSGEENSATDMGRFVRGLDTLREQHGATVCVVHHSGVGLDTKLRARGSSAFLGALDGQLVLLAGKDGRRTLHITKAKEFEAPAPECFRLQSVELPAQWGDGVDDAPTSAVIVPTASLGDHGGLPDKQRAALAMVEKMPGAARAECAKVLVAEGVATSRQGAYGLIANLIKAGEIRFPDKNGGVQIVCRFATEFTAPPSS